MMNGFSPIVRKNDVREDAKVRFARLDRRSRLMGIVIVADNGNLAP